MHAPHSHVGSLRGPSTSPFSIAERQDAAELIDARRERMKRGGYSTPERYFSLSLSELNRAARTGDLYATLQLADRYYYEASDAQFEDGFDLDSPPQTKGRELFEAAALAGHGEVLNRLTLIAETEKNREQLATWTVFAEKIGQPLKEKVDLSASERQAAEARVAVMLKQLPLLR